MHLGLSIEKNSFLNEGFPSEILKACENQNKQSNQNKTEKVSGHFAIE